MPKHKKKSKAVLLLSQNADGTPWLIQSPRGMDAREAEKLCDAVFDAANAEAKSSPDGMCADGLAVHNRIAQLLEAKGFDFPWFEIIKDWD